MPLLLLGLLITIPSAADAADGMVIVELNGGYLQGNFGTTNTAEVLNLSVGIGYETERYDIGVTIPYVSVSESTGYSASGLGDVVLRSSLAVMSEDMSAVNLRVGALVKTPTADASNELGSGEFDAAGFLGVSRHFSRVLVNVVAGYFKAGDSDTVNYDDVVYIGIGAGRLWNRTGAFISVDQQFSPVSDADIASSATLGLRQLLGNRWIGGVNANLGLSASAPDYGASLSISHSF